MTLNGKSDNFAEIQELWSDEKIEDALELLSKLEESRVLHPRVLVLKYLCLATSKTIDSELEELENILSQALELDSDYLPAILELAYFKLNVLDKPSEAVHLFEKATAISKENVTEAILGQARCIAELKNSESAISFINEQQGNLISPVKLEAFMNEVDIFALE